MKLFLNYQSQESANPNQVDGLYVYDIVSTDVVTMSWNGGASMASSSWDGVLLRKTFTSGSVPTSGYFDVVLNGQSIRYGYLSNYYGGWLLECGTGLLTHIAGVNGLGSVWGADTAKVKFNGGTEIAAFAHIDGTSTKKRQAAFVSDVPFASGATVAVEVRIYSSLVYNYSGGWTSTIASVTCPDYEPVAQITTSTIDCTTTIINGTAIYTDSGTTADLYQNGVLLQSVAITGSGFYKTFQFTGLILKDLGGETLEVRLIDGVQVGESTTATILNVGCNVPVAVEYVPTVTSYDLCNLECVYQKTLTGTCDFSGDVAVYVDGVLSFSGIANGATWSAKYTKDQEGSVYRAYGVAKDGSDIEINIDPVQDCDVACVLSGTIKGTAEGTDSGIITMYEYPVTETDAPVATGIIKNERWTIKSDQMASSQAYVFYVIVLNEI